MGSISSYWENPTERIEIPTSITAVEFYRKKGYEYQNGIKELDDERHYRLEKFRKI